MSGLNPERVLIAAAPIAVTRKQYGQPIGKFQIIQDKLAFLCTSLASERQYVFTNAIAKDKGQGTNSGYATVCHVRDSKDEEILEGTQEIRKNIISREQMQQWSNVLFHTLPKVISCQVVNPLTLAICSTNESRIVIFR